MAYRIYIKKKSNFQVESLGIQKDLLENLNEDRIHSIDLYNIYDIFGADNKDLELLKTKVLSEIVTDDVFEQIDLEGENYLAMEYLPGQYDQRADSAEQCLMLLNNKDTIKIRSGRLLIFNGQVRNFANIKNYLINPIEMREKNLSLLSIDENIEIDTVSIYHNFINFTQEELKTFLKNQNLAMSLEDLIHIQQYFKNEEQRDPSETEIKVLDTYWSDHCRHTTFETYLKDISIESGTFQESLQQSLEKYCSLREKVHANTKAITLMDMATICGKYFRQIGKLDDMEISEEINACSIEVQVDIDGKKEDWLLMFKNETHNHPTEIEPFGGASTCIGGAIRDPLSGRSYVYQAMRITGAGNILEGIKNTLEHKLPQEKISKSAAHGYSSYGNQIGLATTFVKEIYHDGYKAKRMEVGAVVGAVPKSWVRRETPKAGDVVILIGGKTGRDGIGGATGSSKEHNEDSLLKCSSEVQKGNAPIERRIQRLFRNPKLTKLIKKSNDFGAGGVSVAIGEIARGVEIELDKISVKYLGLNATELAISESQERMAVVVSPEDVSEFQELVYQENLESSLVAKVTNEERLVIKYKGKTYVNISRKFLDTNGVRQEQKVIVDKNKIPSPFYENPNNNIIDNLLTTLKDLNGCSQRGMVEMFDASIGKSTVLMPYGGKYQLTEAEASVQKIPTDKFTNTCSIMSYGYNPKIAEYSPYLGAQYAVIESLARIVAVGGDYRKARLSFQEYFERLGKDPYRWGKVFSSLLGSIEAQLQFETPAIGGKDSMSGSFKDLDVPPTLISFALVTENTKHITSPEFKAPNNYITLIKTNPSIDAQPNYQKIKENFALIMNAIQEEKIISSMTVRWGGIAETLAKMSFGNKIGLNISSFCDPHNPEYEEGLFNSSIGDIIVESKEPLDFGMCLGKTTDTLLLTFNGESISIEKCIHAWEEPLHKLYPYTTHSKDSYSKDKSLVNKPSTLRSTSTGADHMIFETWDRPYLSNKLFQGKTYYEKPKVLIAVFPGSNCEYDTQKAFEQAGAEVDIFVFNNLGVEEIKYSIRTLSQKLAKSQIFVIPGGFSAGDEPDGSGKFIANILQNPLIKDSITTFLERDGLILGICNGFQALIKLGLLPYGSFDALTVDSPTLFRNDINRHVSRIQSTKICSTNSPWLSSFSIGDIHQIPMSHGEGKLFISKELAQELFAKGQVITQYCDEYKKPTMHGDYNPNGSCYAIESIVSPCGHIFGKMGHSERYEEGLFKNIIGNKTQDIFTNGVNYFKKGVQ